MTMRLANGAGSLIDREKPVAFTFEGQTIEGFDGDTVASALLANDIWTLSRSFKYHRPRGPLTMAGHDANTLVQLPDEPNVLADRLPIASGLTVKGQNYAGSLARDRRSLIGTVSGFLPVGFYYRSFYKPRGAWKVWEPIVRDFAGLGRVNVDSRHGYYDKQYLFADLAVVGGGPAGLSAALEASRAGLEVILIDEMPTLGGALNFARFVNGHADGLADAVTSDPNIQVLSGATCTGWFADNWLAVVRGNRFYKLRAKQVAVATGAIEQPMVFRNNDLPGVVVGSAAQRLIRLYGVKPGTRAVVVAANADGYGVALDLHDAGVDVAALVDLWHDASPCHFSDQVRDAGIRVVAGHAVSEAHGRDRVTGVTVAPIVGEGECAPSGERIDCDLLCVSVGYAPAAGLICHTGIKLGYDGDTHMFTAGGTLRDGLMASGSVTGAHALEAALAQGRRAGWAAAKALGANPGAEPAVPNDLGNRGVNHPWPIFPHPKGRDFIDFDEDLTVRDIGTPSPTATARSNWSSASRPSAWAPAKAATRRSTRRASPPRRPAAMWRKSAPPRSARRCCRRSSPRSPAAPSRRNG